MVNRECNRRLARVCRPVSDTRIPLDVNLKGDSKQTLQALVPLLQRKADRSWQDKLVAEMKGWWKSVEAEADVAVPAGIVNPQKVFWELGRRLPDRCILSADAGTTANWYARDIPIRRGMMASGSGNLASMGAAVPYALGAKFCHPDRVCIATTGDGAMQMNGINVLITVGKYWKEWSDPRWICMVLNNRDLNQVTWEQRVMSGDVKFEASQTLPDFPYAAYAESIGLRGIRVDKPEQVADAWEHAMSADRPCVIEAVSDPDVPTLPPHITLQQARLFTKSLLKGDPNEAGVITQSIKGMVAGLMPKGGQ